MLRILLAEDQTMFREILSTRLARRAEISDVLEAEDGHTAVRIFMEHRPDIVLIDVSMSEANAFDIARAIRRIDPGARIIFLSRQTFDSDLEEALSLGARGFILKTDELDTLFQAITIVSEGGMFFSEPIRKRLCVEKGELRLSQSSCTRAVAGLTPRERELLTYLGKGASLKDAAEAMAVSYKTADNQKASLMRKLDIHDRVELARFAIREGLVSLSSDRSRAHPSTFDPNHPRTLSGDE